MNAIATETRMRVHLDQSLRASSRGSAAQCAELDILLRGDHSRPMRLHHQLIGGHQPGGSPFDGDVYCDPGPVRPGSCRAVDADAGDGLSGRPSDTSYQSRRHAPEGTA